jgi:hypothetical protein
MLDCLELLQSIQGMRDGARQPGRTETLLQHLGQQIGQKADEDVGLHASVAMVVYGPDLDHRLEQTECALDFHQLTVGLHDLGGAQIGMVGLQHEDPVVPALLRLALKAE